VDKIGKIGIIWVNFNNLNQIWVIETASLTLGHCWKDLGEAKEVHSDLHML